MTKDEDFKLLKIQNTVLKVNIDCDGCKYKVKKLLHRIEGVYTVSVDAEHQKVTVSGNVDSATLIKKLARAGKHAELWSQKPSSAQGHKHPNQQHQTPHPNASKNKNNNNKDQAKQNLMQGLKTFKNQHNNKLPASTSSDEDDCNDDEDDCEEDALRFLQGKVNQLNLLNQANNSAAAANAKKNGNGSGGNGNNFGPKKNGGNPNQNQVSKNPHVGLDPKVINLAANQNKMGNFGGGNPLQQRQGDGKERLGDINGMMGLGLHGLGGANGLGFHQAQQQPSGNVNFPGSMGLPPGGGGGGFGGLNQQHHQLPMMMNLPGYQNHPSMMNLRGHNNNMMQQQPQPQPQPQMVYHRATQMPPYTGFYYPYCHPSQYVSNNSDNGSDYGSHLFSDENANGCVVM